MIFHLLLTFLLYENVKKQECCAHPKIYVFNDLCIDITEFLFNFMLYLFTKIIEINNYIWYQLNNAVMLLNRGIFSLK